MPDRIYVGFGPHGGAMAAQAMETGRLEKKEKLDEEQKNEAAQLSMLAQGLAIKCAEANIGNPIEIIHDGKLTGNKTVDQLLPALWEAFSKASPPTQAIALKSANAIYEGVIKQVTAEQKRQQGTFNQAMNIAGKYNLPIPVPGQTTTPGQMPQLSPGMSGILGNLPQGILGSQIQPESPLGQGVMTGDVGAPQYMINPPPAKPSTTPYGEARKQGLTWQDYLRTKQEITRRPTKPEKVTKIKVYDTSTKQYTRVPEKQLDNQRYVLPENVPKVNYQSNLLIAAKIAGIDPKKVVSGEITQQEAEKLAKVYKDKFGAMNLLGAILSGGLPQSTIQYDAQGNRVQ